MKTFDQLSVIGLREWVALPDLGVAGLRAKIDTGASTSSLHATDIQPFERDGHSWVRFTAHLGTVMQLRHRHCEAPLLAGLHQTAGGIQARVARQHGDLHWAPGRAEESEGLSCT